MDSVRDFLSCRRPLFTTWTFGRRRYYSPLVHAVAARMDHAALSGAVVASEASTGSEAAAADNEAENHPTAVESGVLVCS